MLRLTRLLDAKSQTPARPRQTTASARNATLRRFWVARPFYLMMLPGILWYLVYRYLPMGGLILAFKEYDFAAGILRSPWADPWYRYFQIFFNSPYFEQLLWNTLLISGYKIFFGMVPPLLLAILLNETRTLWYRRTIQTLSYMPHFLSWVIIYGILIALGAVSMDFDTSSY